MIKRSALNPRLAEVGKIKIGGKGEERTAKESGNKYRLPVKYDHFVITTTEKDKYGNFIIDNELMDRLGGKPRELSIRLLFDDIDMNFHTEFQMYAGRKRICHGDGETSTRTKKDGTVETVACNPETCQFVQDGKCKPSGILSCMITQTMELGGVYRFRTHSWNSISSILAALEFFSNNTNGILQGLPLKLKMVKKNTEEHGQIDYVTVVLDGLEMVQMRQRALEEYQNRNLLGIEMKRIEGQAKEEGFLNDTDDEGDVEDEFYGQTEADGPRDVSPQKGASADDVGDALKEKKQQADKAENGAANNSTADDTTKDDDSLF